MTQERLFDKPEIKHDKKLLRDPAMAAAIAKCCVYHMEPNTGIAIQVHPGPCRFCEFPFDKKIAAVRDFYQWAGFATIRPDDDGWPEIEPSVEAFMQLPREEQARLATLAAGYTPDEYGEPRLDTGYEYPDGYAENKWKEAHGKRIREGSISNDESVTADKKRTSAGETPASTGGLGGRPAAGDRDGGRVGGSAETARTQRGRLPDRAEEAPGPDEGDLPVPPRYVDEDGSQPF